MEQGPLLLTACESFLLPQGNQNQNQRQCINPDGTISNDPQGSLSNPNVAFFDFLDVDGYLGPGFGLHFGIFYDRSTGNYGLFRSFDYGGGLRCYTHPHYSRATPPLCTIPTTPT